MNFEFVSGLKIFFKLAQYALHSFYASYCDVYSLDALVEEIHVKAKHKVIDLTKKRKTVESLTEARITCTATEKDSYLYYFVKRYPGRTLVFANSKDCIRRLVSVFTLLKTDPLPLHADMHQNQRLKNLDRFKGDFLCFHGRTQNEPCPSILVTVEI